MKLMVETHMGSKFRVGWIDGSNDRNRTYNSTQPSSTTLHIKLGRQEYSFFKKLLFKKLYLSTHIIFTGHNASLTSVKNVKYSSFP